MDSAINKLELLPGEHTVGAAGGTARYEGVLWDTEIKITGKWLLKFMVEPGHRYFLEYEKVQEMDVGKYRVKVFIKDLTTKKIVSEIVEKKE